MNMKKILTFFCALAVSACALFAQDVNAATDLYNNGATALSTGDNAGALSYFQKSHAEAVKCGEAGKEIKANCESVIPQLMVRVAKENVKAGKFDAAVAKLVEAKDVATKFGNAEEAKEATAMIPQVYMQKGNTLLKSKNAEGAISAYKKVIEINPSNGKAYLNMGQAYESIDNDAKAEEAYKAAAANGQAKSANKKLSKIYLTKASKLNVDGKYAEALAMALKSNTYAESANAYYIAGRACQNSGKKADAVKYYNKYLELSPSAANANDVRKVVADLQK